MCQSGQDLRSADRSMVYQCHIKFITFCAHNSYFNNIVLCSPFLPQPLILCSLWSQTPVVYERCPSKDDDQQCLISYAHIFLITNQSVHYKGYRELSIIAPPRHGRDRVLKSTVEGQTHPSSEQRRPTQISPKLF